MNVKGQSKKNGRRPLVVLSLEQASVLCREFLPIGESLFYYVAALETACHQAFMPLYKFEESFCKTPEDAAIHKQRLIENAKWELGNPFPMRLHPHPNKSELLYSSRLIDELCRGRDAANGMAIGKLVSVYPGGTLEVRI
jgi:hypothetical protein